jgi:hypothetical protein
VSRPGGCTPGTAAEFDQARAAIEAAWQVFPSKRSEADLQAWRDQCDYRARRRYVSAFAIIEGGGIVALYLLVLYWSLDAWLK